MAREIDPKLLTLLVCPDCKGPLCYECENSRLICRFDKQAFPIVEGIPMMTASAAIKLTLEALPK